MACDIYLFIFEIMIFFFGPDFGQKKIQNFQKKKKMSGWMAKLFTIQLDI